MVKSIKTAIDEYRTQSFFKHIKKKRIVFPNLLKKYKNFEKYIPDLQALCEWDNDLFFGYKDKGDIEHQFGKLMLLRIHDYAESIVKLIFFESDHSIYPVMRALVESIYLLQYVDKHPKYIKRFMNKTKERGINFIEMKRDVGNKQLAGYYDFLSKMHHPNPIAIKLTYYKLKVPKGDIVISTKPHDYEARYIAMIESLLSLYFLGIFYINDIFSKDWKKKRNI